MSLSTDTKKTYILQRSFELKKSKILDEGCEAKNKANIAAIGINLADTNSISESEVFSKLSVDVLKDTCKQNTATGKTFKFENLTIKCFPHNFPNPSVEETLSQSEKPSHQNIISDLKNRARWFIY